MELCMMQKRDLPAAGSACLPVNETRMKNLPGQIRIGLLEPNAKVSDEIYQKVLFDLAGESGYDFPLFRFYRKIPIADLPKCAPWLHLVLVYMGCEDLELRLQEIYQANPDCMIVLYGEPNDEMEDLFPMRPCLFFYMYPAQTPEEWDETYGEFRKALEELLLKKKHSNPIYRFASRTKTYLVAQNDILYLYNKERTTFVVLREQGELAVNRPLRELKAQMGAAFLPIHKSFMVNTHYVRALDKKNHTVEMENGDCLGISDAYYKAVCRRLECIGEPDCPV